MHTVWIWAVALAAGAAVTFAAAQQGPPGATKTDRPGDPTRAVVWVQNRGGAEAVPVSLEQIASRTPLPVEVVNASGATALATAPLGPPRPTAWEYRTLDIAAGQDPSAVLAPAGEDGWETTGLQFPAAGGTRVVLKRPR
jgi:hypothetical protein